MAESTTTTALAVYSFTNKKPLKRLGLSQASITPGNERVDAKQVVIVVHYCDGLGEIDIVGNEPANNGHNHHRGDKNNVGRALN